MIFKSIILVTALTLTNGMNMNRIRIARSPQGQVPDVALNSESTTESSLEILGNDASSQPEPTPSISSTESSISNAETAITSTDAYVNSNSSSNNDGLVDHVQSDFSLSGITIPANGVRPSQEFAYPPSAYSDDDGGYEESNETISGDYDRLHQGGTVSQEFMVESVGPDDDVTKEDDKMEDSKEEGSKEKGAIKNEEPMLQNEKGDSNLFPFFSMSSFPPQIQMIGTFMSSSSISDGDKTQTILTSSNPITGEITQNKLETPVNPLSTLSGSLISSVSVSNGQKTQTMLLIKDPVTGEIKQMKYEYPYSTSSGSTITNPSNKFSNEDPSSESKNEGAFNDGMSTDNSVLQGEIQSENTTAEVILNSETSSATTISELIPNSSESPEDSSIGNLITDIFNSGGSSAVSNASTEVTPEPNNNQEVENQAPLSKNEVQAASNAQLTEMPEEENQPFISNSLPGKESGTSMNNKDSDGVANTQSTEMPAEENQPFISNSGVPNMMEEAGEKLNNTPQILNVEADQVPLEVINNRNSELHSTEIEAENLDASFLSGHSSSATSKPDEEEKGEKRPATESSLSKTDLPSTVSIPFEIKTTKTEVTNGIYSAAKPLPEISLNKQQLPQAESSGNVFKKTSSVRTIISNTRATSKREPAPFQAYSAYSDFDTHALTNFRAHGPYYYYPHGFDARYLSYYTDPYYYY